ncbi:MAG: excinuclease ABC subunit UvrC [Deltaproteobacteria bacterium]|nr:excinuclease ABC subunit UvrC [Deltaproteobacteria bacterium]
MNDVVRQKLESLPTEPGVYLMKDRSGEVIYVGKAVNLRSRVRSYFTRGDERAFVALLDEILDDLEVIVVRTEKEALLLENELIKKHKPRFNVVLRDDKSFICLRLNEKAEWPRLEIVRAAQVQRGESRGGRTFGPFSSASSIRETLRLINRHFGLRTCSDHQLEQCRRRQRPCMQYQIGRCPGPCVQAITPEEYARNVHDVELFLKGKEATVLERLRSRMEEASQRLEFESAARLRDQIRAIERSLEQQRMVSPEDVDRDVVGVYREADRLVIYMLYIRGGRLTGGRTFPFAGQEFPSEELISSFVDLYYGQDTPLPDEVLLPLELEDAEATEAWLSEQRGRRVRVLTPRRGAKAELVEMARKNAETAFHESRRTTQELSAMLERLQSSLGLAKLPRRIECFDISLFQGAAAVGSKVSFLDGAPDKSQYRRYRIKTVTGTDDFAMLYEVLGRRLAQGELPDLFVIDGGKGQLASAAAALRDRAVAADIVGLAKSRTLEGGPSEPVERSAERVFVLGRKDPVVLRQDSPELFLLTRVRDEAHRFAVTYHRLLRGKNALTSAVESIPGVGTIRRRQLLRHFGSLRRLRQASVEDIAQVEGIGEGLARQIHQVLQAHPAPAPKPTGAGSEGP